MTGGRGDRGNREPAEEKPTGLKRNRLPGSDTLNKLLGVTRESERRRGATPTDVAGSAERVCT